MLRIGWVGCGTHATQMLLPQVPRLPAHSPARIVALCDRDAGRLAAAAARLNLPPEACFADVAAMLDAGGLDAVGAAVGPAAHVEIACAALARDLPVFLEKPPAADLAFAAA